MSNNKYIIKSLAPWMIDELLAISKITNFELFFLRKQDEFYQDEIKKLKSNGIAVYDKPFLYNHFLKKTLIIIQFLFSNITKFKFNYNSAIGLKGITWFLKLDISKFDNDSKIHAQFATQAALISLLIKKYFNNKPSYTFTFHAHDIYFDNKWFAILTKNSKKAFSISNYNIDYVKKNFLNSKTIVLSRLGVFRDNDKNGLNSESKTLTIGLISWFTEKKGILYLLRAMNKINKMEGNSIKLILAGDGPLKNDIVNFIHDNKLENFIDYIGKVKNQDKKVFFNKLDAFILPSITLNNDKDGIPVVLMEAVSYGLPLISTNVSGIPEICINNYNGFLIEEKNINAIVESILKLSNNILVRKEFSKNSLTISDKYDIEINSLNKIKEMDWL